MKTITSFVLLGLLFISCSKDRLTASGDKITQVREVRDFTGVDADGSTDIHISYGTEFKVTLKGSDNLIPYFKTEVIGRNLHLGYERVNVRHDDIQVYVTLPAIQYINLSGSAHVDISGGFPLIDHLQVVVSGSGEVEAEDAVEVAEAEISISGSGEADLKKVSTAEAAVHVSGSGDARISVTDFLKARISGSGKIYYSGNPQLDSQISGSGKLIKF